MSKQTIPAKTIIKCDRCGADWTECAHDHEAEVELTAAGMPKGERCYDLCDVCLPHVHQAIEAAMKLPAPRPPRPTDEEVRAWAQQHGLQALTAEAAREAFVYEQRLRNVLDAVRDYLPPDGIDVETAMNRIIAQVDPWPAGGASVADMPKPAEVRADGSVLYDEAALDWAYGRGRDDERGDGVAVGSEAFERWRKELRACIVDLLYIAHASKSPAECKAHHLYNSVMHLVDGGPSLASGKLNCAARGDEECMAYGACEEAGRCVRAVAGAAPTQGGTDVR